MRPLCPTLASANTVNSQLLATCRGWPNDDVEQIRVTKTELLISNSHDAGSSWLEHLDWYPGAEAEFVKTMNMIGLADHLLD
jgi:hypothetical protein